MPKTAPIILNSGRNDRTDELFDSENQKDVSTPAIVKPKFAISIKMYNKDQTISSIISDVFFYSKNENIKKKKIQKLDIDQFYLRCKFQLATGHTITRKDLFRIIIEINWIYLFLIIQLNYSQ